MRFNTSKFNDHWEDKELSELGSFQRGKSRHRPRNDPKLFEDGKYPLIQTGEIKEAGLYIQKHVDAYNDFGLAQSKLWSENTLCITIAANIAETALLGYPMCIPDSVVGFNANPNESSELFMHYVFSYIRKAIQSSASGSIQDNINIDYLTGLKFKIPKKTYQEKIVSLLSNIDKKIELNHKINMELESMTKLIYDYWFIQFDFPDENGKPYKSSGRKMVYNEVLKREIPDGWEMHSISEKLTIGSGHSFSSDSYTAAGKYKVITIKNVQDHGLKTEKVDYVKNIPNNLDSFCILEMQDILISLTGNVGRLCLVDEEDLLLNQRVGKFLCDEVHKNYMYLTYLRPELRTWMERISTGSGQKNLSPIEAVKINCALPPTSILERFNTLINNNISLIVKNSIEIRELEELRDWLLPMLMNGQVKIN